MTRETRIALLVGLAFIVLFGLVLGQRSLSLSSSSRSGSSHVTAATKKPPPEVAVAMLSEREERAALSPHGASGLTDVAVGPGPSTRPAELAEGPGPATRPGPSTRPAPPGSRNYTIAQGDTLIRIARKVYGQGHENDYRRLFEANKDKLPALSANLKVGAVLTVPPLEVRPGVEPRPAPVEPAPEARKTYVVQKGDYLGKIARAALGSDSPSSIKRLMDANKDKVKDPARLKIGTTLTIPA